MPLSSIRPLISSSLQAILGLLLLFSTQTNLLAQSAKAQLIIPAAVFDGEEIHEGWSVLIIGDTIARVGPQEEVMPHTNASVEVISLPNATLLPGLIEGHSHMLLHPYDETNWNDQVLKESEAERAIRGAIHAQRTLEAGFTTARDLGSEGAGYADVGLRQAIEKGVIPGPRLLVAGPAIVATGSYGPKGFADHVHVPLGAQEADAGNLIQVTREQIGGGADLVKVYADYRWGANGEARPTFSEAEIRTIVETAASSGRPTVAHAATEEGMRRATLAGVRTIEHGDGGTPEVYELMAERRVALCPTLAAPDAILQYRGWRKGIDPEPARITRKKASFRAALAAGVTIVAGGDSGVFSHGDNARELELMVEYGMPPLDVLRSATSVNAEVFDLDDQIGRIQVGLLADLIAVDGRPDQDISSLWNIRLVMQAGEIIVEEEK